MRPKPKLQTEASAYLSHCNADIDWLNSGFCIAGEISAAYLPSPITE